MDKPTVADPGLYASALAGLRATPKTLDAKWFYDETGSGLFEEITRLPEYYPTRVETGILRDSVGDMARHVPAGAALVEFGSGASVKTRILLDRIPEIGAYVPVDISAAFLDRTVRALRADYPRLPVHPAVADFLEGVALPAAVAGRPKVAFFPGSTIGNLPEAAAVGLLREVRSWEGVAAFLIGFDLVKTPDVLIPAYDDAAGVTAAFNLNLLRRLNREAGATFDMDGFAHEARWNAAHSRIEMHLVSRAAQVVTLGGAEVRFASSESIHTENSRKYTRLGVTRIAAGAGWSVARLLTDDAGWFAVAVLTPGDGAG